MNENKTMISDLFELQEEKLNNVVGGKFGDMGICPVCGKPQREGYICTWCEMADGVVTCFKCRGRLTKEGGCSNCGTTWEDYVQLTKRLLGEE